MDAAVETRFEAFEGRLTRLESGQQGHSRPFDMTVTRLEAVDSGWTRSTNC